MDIKKNDIKVTVSPEFLGKVLDGNGQELREFRGLSSEERNAIMTEAHQRSFLSGFLGNGCSWERMKYQKNEGKSSKKASGKKTTTNDGVNMDNEVLGNVVYLATKAKVKEVKTEYVVVNKVVVNDGKTTMVPSREPKEVEVKKPKAKAKVLFYFNPENNVLEVKVLEVTAKDPATESRCSKELEKELKMARDDMECFDNLNRFVKYFFDTLHVHGYAHISGSEAVLLRKIYKHAMVVYPNFAKLKHSKQVSILDKGCERTRSLSAGFRDIHAFAKGVFEAMCQEEGIIDVVYKHDFITNQMMTYTKIGEHRRDRVNPDNHRQIWEKNCLIYVDYRYGKANIRTSLLAFDLWDLLARGVRNSERAVETTTW